MAFSIVKRQEKRPMRPEKHDWIAEIVPGRSFADVGGLWGTVNETVTVAHAGGAASLAMMDLQGEGNRWWQAFDERLTGHGVPLDAVERTRIDITEFRRVVKLPAHDVVHCSGILYHVTDPLGLIRNLALIANEWLILGSMTIPDRVETRSGWLETRPGEMRLIPALDRHQRTILTEYFESKSIRVGGLSTPEQERMSSSRTFKTGPWWFLFTPATMRAMCETVGLEVQRESMARNGSCTLLCRKR